MARRSQQKNPEILRLELLALIQNFENELKIGDLRGKVRALVPAHYLLRDLGSSLIPKERASSARDRIILYLTSFPRQVIKGDELMVVAGIGEWARRVGKASARVAGSVRVEYCNWCDGQGNGR